MNQSRLGSLDVLRALAALAVCFYHFKRDSITSLDAVWSVSSYGYLGVDVFFVISGFVIPLMLLKMKFTFVDTGFFLFSRFLRLYPAYTVAGLLAIALWFLSSWTPGFRGESPSISFSELLSNSLLICDFTGEGWIIPVFWTLAIEAQYYFLIALSFPLLANESIRIRYSVLAAWVVAPLLAGVGPTVFTWSALFAIGILCHLKANRLIGLMSFWIFLSAACATHALTKGPVSAVVGAATGLVILYLPEVRSRILIWIGGISYSLYLLHPLVGGRVMNIAVRLPDTLWIQSLALLLGVLVAVIASAIFFKLIERPSHEFSRSIRHQKRRTEKCATGQPL
jgi:peptidoglycan/LPS O-acetylase OafA/YrhL